MLPFQRLAGAQQHSVSFLFATFTQSGYFRISFLTVSLGLLSLLEKKVKLWPVIGMTP